MRLTAIFAAMLLAGCVTKPDFTEIKVPVTVGCVGALPARPEEIFGRGAWPGDAEAAKVARIESLTFQAYSTKLEAIIAGCPKR